MTPASITLDGRSLAIGDVVRIAREPGVRPRVETTARDALVASRRLVERAIASGQTIYGINTGFGKLANVRIAPDQLEALQVNLIRSHAAGIGTPLPPGVVRAVMLLRANVLLRPTSGVRPDGQVMDTTVVEVPVKRAMIAASDHVVLVADVGKFPGTGMSRVCGPRDLNTVVTNAPADERTKAAFREAGVEVIEVGGTTGQCD